MALDCPGHIHCTVVLLTVWCCLLPVHPGPYPRGGSSTTGTFHVAYKAVPQCGSCSWCFPTRGEQVKCLCETVWSVKEQVLGKQTRQGFNFGVCLEVGLTEHVEVIFRGAYELFKSMSLTSGGRNIWVTLNVEPEQVSGLVTDAIDLGPLAWLSFIRQDLVLDVKGYLFRRGSWREQWWQLPLQYVSFNPCEMRNNFSPSPWPGSIL